MTVTATRSAAAAKPRLGPVHDAVSGLPGPKTPLMLTPDNTCSSGSMISSQPMRAEVPRGQVIGRLDVFLAATPGAGKTYAMLAEGSRLAAAGADVVVALVETHGRDDLDVIGNELEVIPTRQITYRDAVFHEPDYDAVRARRPDIVLIDELAHTNVTRSRHENRWQDVKELLDAGIDVMTTLNIAHLDCLQEEVERITKVTQHEFVPEEMVLGARRVEFIDVDPAIVLARLGPRGKFFDADRLAALRELALEWLGNHGVGPASPPRIAITRPAPVVVAVAPGAPVQLVVRRAAELAAQRRAEFIGIHVRPGTGLTGPKHDSAGLERMLEQFGGRYAEVAGDDVALTLARFVQQENASMLVIGDTGHSSGHRLVHGSIARRTLRLLGPVEVHVVPPSGPAAGHRGRAWISRDLRRPAALSPRRRLVGRLLALLLPTALLAALATVRAEVGLAAALLCALLSVLLVGAVGGLGAALLATITGLLSADFYFTLPYYTLRVAHWVDIVGLVVFGLAGVIVGILVDVLTARARQSDRFRAEAAQLARVAGRILAGPVSSRADLVAELRRTFDLDSVGILCRGASGWQVQASAGSPVSDDPGAARFSAELAHDVLLVMTGHSLTHSDAELVRVFCAELLLARRRAQHDELRSSTSGSDRTA
jgi:two-component system, OmpR family, sensor histidine kinase KdpD